MLVKYEFALVRTLRTYPDGPARIISEIRTGWASRHILVVGPHPSLHVAWSDNVDELVAFAQEQGWKVEK